MVFNKKIKILYTIPNFNTAGSGMPLYKIATNLDKNIFEVEVACIHTKGELYNKVKKSGLKIHIINLYKRARPISKMLLKCYELSKILKKINPNIIHSYNYSSDYTEPIAAKMAGIKWIYTKKNMSWYGSSYRSWKLRSWLSDGIICQNTDMINDFFPNWKKVSLIPIGVDSRQYFNNNTNYKVKEKWGISMEERVIISVANLIPVKGIEILIKAFELLANDYSDWRLMIVGIDTTEYGKRLKKKILEHSKIKHKIIFTGVQSKVKELLDISEIYVQPSINPGEGAPIGILEAMSNGKVIIGSNVAGIRDQLSGFPNHLFNPGDVIQLKEKLVEFVSNDIKNNIKLGKKFVNHIINHHDLKIESKLLQKYYLRLLYGK